MEDIISLGGGSFLFSGKNSGHFITKITEDIYIGCMCLYFLDRIDPVVFKEIEDIYLNPQQKINFI